jgi:hypothetical protein
MSRSTVVLVIRTCHICGAQFAGPYGTHIRESDDHQSTLVRREAEQKMVKWRADHPAEPQIDDPSGPSVRMVRPTSTPAP